MLRRALIVVVFLACFSQLGRAAGSSNEFLAHLVGHLYRQGESFACFSRQYSAAHLAAHPGQQVTFMKALVDAHFSEPWAPHQPALYMYQLRLAFRFRGREESLTGVAECGDGTPKDSLRGGSVCAGPGDKPSHLALDGNKSSRDDVPRRRRSLGAGADRPASRHRQESVWPRRRHVSLGAHGSQAMRGPRFRQAEAVAPARAVNRSPRRGLPLAGRQAF